MLLAPLTLPASGTGPHPSQRPRPLRRIGTPLAAATAPRSRWAWWWLLLGIAALALVPSLAWSHTLGWSGAYWLVAAPLLELAWLGRRRLARVCAAAFRRPRATRRPCARRSRGRRWRAVGTTG